MEIQQLKYFVQAARAGNFREAADDLFVSRTALSKSMSRLEAELGYALFTRERDGVELTAQGTRLFELVSPLVTEFERVEQELKAPRCATTVTVLIPNSWRRAFEGRIEIFGLEHPEVRIQILGGSDAEIIQRVKEGKADLVVSHLPLPDMLDAGKALVHAPLYMAMASENPLSQKAVLGPEDMLNQPMIYYSCGYDKVFWVPTKGANERFDNDLMHIYEVLARNEAVMPTPLLCAPEHPYNVVYRRFVGPYDTVVMSGYIPKRVNEGPVLEQACLALREAMVIDAWQ